MFRRALENAGIPARPINAVAQVVADPQVVARGMNLDLDGVPRLGSPIVIDGKRQVFDSPVRASAKLPELRSVADLGGVRQRFGK